MAPLVGLVVVHTVRVLVLAMRKPRAFRMLACVALLAAITSTCDAPARLTEQCEWSPSDEKAIESVPLQDFTGTPIGPLNASCDQSSPDLLYVEIRVPGGLDLPSDWTTRDSVGDWTVAGRSSSQTNDPMLCYTSSRTEWATVQVRLWADAITAETRKDQAPCSDESA